jgi:hypothetical protein
VLPHFVNKLVTFVWWFIGPPWKLYLSSSSWLKSSFREGELATFCSMMRSEWQCKYDPFYSKSIQVCCHQIKDGLKMGLEMDSKFLPIVFLCYNFRIRR